MPEVLFVRVLDVRRQMSLTLNGFHEDHEMGAPAYGAERTKRLQKPVDDWPDWSDPDENENRDGQSVQICIQASEIGDPVSSKLELSHTNMEEEPWDDFEDTEPTSDLSPTVPLSDRGIFTPPRAGTTTCVKQAPESLKLGSSKPLKLTSALHESTQSKITSSWGDGWAQEQRDSENSQSPTNVKAKPSLSQKNTGIGDLGEEFTIKVKKKGEQDPELDLFADMMPDIKLSCPTLLPLNENSAHNAGLSSGRSQNIESLQADAVVDTLTLSAKFAAANLTEVSKSGSFLLLLLPDIFV